MSDIYANLIGKSFPLDYLIDTIPDTIEDKLVFTLQEDGKYLVGLEGNSSGGSDSDYVYLSSLKHISIDTPSTTYIEVGPNSEFKDIYDAFEFIESRSLALVNIKFVDYVHTIVSMSTAEFTNYRWKPMRMSGLLDSRTALIIFKNFDKLVVTGNIKIVMADNMSSPSSVSVMGFMNCDSVTLSNLYVSYDKNSSPFNLPADGVFTFYSCNYVRTSGKCMFYPDKSRAWNNAYLPYLFKFSHCGYCSILLVNSSHIDDSTVAFTDNNTSDVNVPTSKILNAEFCKFVNLDSTANYRHFITNVIKGANALSVLGILGRYCDYFKLVTANFATPANTRGYDLNDIGSLYVLEGLTVSVLQNTNMNFFRGSFETSTILAKGFFLGDVDLTSVLSNKFIFSLYRSRLIYNRHVDSMSYLVGARLNYNADQVEDTRLSISSEVVILNGLGGFNIAPNTLTAQGKVITT